MGCGPSAKPHKISSVHSLNAQSANFRGANPKSKRRHAVPPEGLPPGYAILFAVDNYTNMLSLKAAVRDAESVGKRLEELNFKILRRLYNEKCTATAVESLLRQEFRRIPPRSRVVFFFAGHGRRDRDTQRTFYCTVDATEDNLCATAFDLEQIYLLTDFWCYQQAWVMDFCYSGGACASVVRRGGARFNFVNSPSISFVTAGRTNEEALEAPMPDTPVLSPMVTPEASPDVTPVPSPKNASGATMGFPPVVLPHALRVASLVGKPKGVFSAALSTALRNASVRKRHLGKKNGAISLTQIFVALRSQVQNHSSTFGHVQTPQISHLHWYRNKPAEGEFFF